MKKNINLSVILTSLICLIPFVLSVIFYKELPDLVATHWNSSGVPDGYSSKMFAAFALPTILFVLNIITNFAIEKDPNSKNNSKVIMIIGKWTVPMVSLFVQIYILSYASGIQFDINSYVYLTVGLLTMVIGNYLPKCQQNTTVGIKTSWALKDKDNWKKTHRFSGYLWVICGFALSINAFINIEYLSIVIIAVIAILPMIYSYMMHKKALR